MKLSFFSLSPPPLLQLVFLPSEWRSPASRRTCSGSWSVACSSPMWLSTPAILVKSWAGPTQPCCVPSARTSDSCSWGPRPGRERHFHLHNRCFERPEPVESRSSALLAPLKLFGLFLRGQGTSAVTVRLQRAGRRTPFAALHLGWKHHRRHAEVRRALDGTPHSAGGEGPPPLFVLVGDPHVHLQR